MGDYNDILHDDEKKRRATRPNCLIGDLDKMFKMLVLLMFTWKVIRSFGLKAWVLLVL